MSASNRALCRASRNPLRPSARQLCLQILREPKMLKDSGQRLGRKLLERRVLAGTDLPLQQLRGKGALHLPPRPRALSGRCRLRRECQAARLTRENGCGGEAECGALSGCAVRGRTAKRGSRGRMKLCFIE